MVEKRISGWFLFSAVFVTVVFGLFFTITERKSWPQQRIHLSATDMKMAPRASTVWCEAVSLSSDHPFIAYQVSHAPHIDPKVLTRQRVDLRFRLSHGKTSTKLKYFLLPSTVLEIIACSSVPGAYLLVFKGDLDVHDCLQSRHQGEQSLSSDDDSDDSSFEVEDWNIEREAVFRKMPFSPHKCASSISIQEIPVTEESLISYGCDDTVEVHPLKINITSADDYIIAIANSNHHHAANQVGLRLLIDRATYTVRKTGESFNMCSLSTACTIALDFASDDRALVWIPEEPNAGRATFTVHAQCKPRLALFAVLSVCLPLVLFLAVAYIVRADRLRRLESSSGVAASGAAEGGAPRVVCDAAFVTPLLVGRCASGAVPSSERQSENCGQDGEPPSYDSLYDPPPPYSCVKSGGTK